METITNLKAKTFETEVKLTWDGNAPKYEVYKDGKIYSTTENKKITVTELRSNTIYGFKVVAAYDDGKSKPRSINIRTRK